jgi:hypothetical protein
VISQHPLRIKPDSVFDPLNTARRFYFLEVIFSEDNVGFDPGISQRINDLSNRFGVFNPNGLLHPLPADVMHSTSEPSKSPIVIVPEIEINYVLQKRRDLALSENERQHECTTGPLLSRKCLLQFIAGPDRVRKVVAKHYADEARILQGVSNHVVKTVTYLKLPFIEPDVYLAKHQVIRELSGKRFVSGTMAEEQIRSPL